MIIIDKAKRTDLNYKKGSDIFILKIIRLYINNNSSGSLVYFSYDKRNTIAVSDNQGRQLNRDRAPKPNYSAK